MKEKLISYNVNGVRAAEKKGLWSFLREVDPAIVMLQEIKALPEDVPAEIRNPEGYHAFWNPAEKKGYSGVATFSKRKPINVEYGCGIKKYDQEGRFLRLDFKEYSVLNVYFPSGTSGEIRQTFKEEFLDDFYKYVKKLKKQYPKLVIAGDINIAHTEIDIHNPVSNKKSSGFLPHEREWVTKFLKLGFQDSFRIFNPDPHHYTWWTYRVNARGNNKGWRIDYQMVTDELAPFCKDHIIHSKHVHSDHCGLELTLEF